MNSYTTEPGTSHGDLLADRLRRLDVSPEQVDQPVQAPDGRHSKPPYDGYGFRPASGMSSPLVPPDRNSPLPDVNGLGWPGELTFHHPIHSTHPPLSAPVLISPPYKQSPPSLASTHPPQKKRIAKLDSPPPCAPS
jgi:Zn-dependent protease with chaperone function